jgi:hypothetical protein
MPPQNPSIIPTLSFRPKCLSRKRISNMGSNFKLGFRNRAEASHGQEPPPEVSKTASTISQKKMLQKARVNVRKLWKRIKPCDPHDANQQDVNQGRVEQPEVPQSKSSPVVDTKSSSVPGQEKRRKTFLRPLNLRKRRLDNKSSTRNRIEVEIDFKSSEETENIFNPEDEPLTSSVNNLDAVEGTVPGLVEDFVPVSTGEIGDAESVFAQLSVIEVPTEFEELDIEAMIRKSKKIKPPKHGDDSILIGMVIIFDPTSELLDSSAEPQCTKRTKLKKLQETEVYEDSLLGKDLDEPSEVSSIEDMLGFHLDCFPAPSALELNTRADERGEKPYCSILPRKTLSDEIEIVFSKDEDEDSEPSGSVYKDEEEDIEIVFYSCQDEEPHGEEESNNGSSSDESSSKYTDCRSNITPLPTEWFLPASEKCLDQDTCSEATPGYEWFHPDHLDVETRKTHTADIFQGVLKAGGSPSTEDTLSFDIDERTDTSGDSSVDCMSVGSGASQVVQSLVEICRI